VQCGIGLLLALLSIPLMLRLIPQNRVYGIRIRKSLASQHNWYEINAYGGKLLFVLGLFLFVFGWSGRDFAPDPTSAWAPVFMIIPLLAFVPIIFLINAYARRLPER
jgi:uncharacterized membrane protein